MRSLMEYPPPLGPGLHSPFSRELRDLDENHGQGLQGVGELLHNGL